MTHFYMLFRPLNALDEVVAGFMDRGPPGPVAGVGVPAAFKVTGYVEGGCLSYYSILYYDALY